MIGILAYGSLITHPGHEVESVLDHVIPDVMTPFPVEYARRSQSRAGAPTLVPVSSDCGKSVIAAILVMKKYSHKDVIQDYLYRRELHAVGDRTIEYNHVAQLSKKNALRIGSLQNFRGLKLVYYTIFPANFAEILDQKRTILGKAELLARTAIDSLTTDTYLNGLDGIQYLLDNINGGIFTRLTEPYSQSILRLTNNSSDLAKARLQIASQKGIIS